MPKPLRRHQSLQPVSREHHHGLLLSWKIREGYRLKIGVERIKDYTDWFWETHLQSHFDFEEKFVFPILEKENKLVKKALKDHRRLKRLFTAKDEIDQSLSLIEEELVAHIRFEERVLFQEIQRIATREELNIIEQAHSKNIADEWKDDFWAKNKKEIDPTGEVESHS